MSVFAKLSQLIMGLLLVAHSSGETGTGTPLYHDCEIRRLSDVAWCLSQIDTNRTLRLNIKANLSCRGTECCPTPLGYFPLLHYKNVIVEGNHFSFNRYSPTFGNSQDTPGCPAIRVSNNSSNIEVRNFTINENAAQGCPSPSVSCPNTITLHGSDQITLSNLKVLNTLGTGIHAWNVKNLIIENSEFKNNGIIGLHIGNKTWSDETGKRYPSANIKIENNKFISIRTNALAIDGVEGLNNKVSGNYFENNHWDGFWKLEGFETFSVSGGGQAYIGIAANLEFSNNVITSGFCRNCHNNAVNGLELGFWEEIGLSPFLSNISVHNNLIVSNTNGIYFNNSRRSILAGRPISPPVRNVKVSENTLVMNKNQVVKNGSNASFSRNTHVGVAISSDFESAVPANLWGMDAPGGRGTRWCKNFDALFGKCGFRLQTQEVGASDSAGYFWQGLARPVTSKQKRAYLNVYYRKGEYPGGTVCLVFQENKKRGPKVTTHCKNIDTQRRWDFEGVSLIGVQIPPKTHQVSVRIGIQHSSSLIDVDRIQLSLE